MKINLDRNNIYDVGTIKENHISNYRSDNNLAGAIFSYYVQELFFIKEKKKIETYNWGNSTYNVLYHDGKSTIVLLYVNLKAIICHLYTYFSVTFVE